MTDFLKTRLLDTLSDQIRKIQKVRECKGFARGKGAPCAQPWHSSGPGLQPQHQRAPREAGMRQWEAVLQPECSEPSCREWKERPGSTMPGLEGNAWQGGREAVTGCSVVRWDAGWMHGAGAGTAMQSLSKAAAWLESPIRLFLKGAACNMDIL